MKTIALIALLSLAPLSNADIVYQINGVNYAPGSTVTVAAGPIVIAIYNTAQQALCYDLGGVIVKGNATFGTPGTSTVYSDNLPGSWSTQNYGYQTNFDGLGNNGELFAISYDIPSIDPTLQGKLFDFTVTFTGPSATFAAADSSLYTTTFGAPITLAIPAAPTPTPAPVTPHGAVIVYRVSANLVGYTFNPLTNPKTIRTCSSPITGYIIADVNTSTLYTNYPSPADVNSPVFIAVSGKSFAVFSAADPNVTAVFDIVRPSANYYQKFDIINAYGRKTGQTMVFPQFDFTYNNTAAFYDNYLMGFVALADIGMTAKSVVPSAIAGSANFEMGPYRKVFGNIALTLDTTYTRAANKTDLRVANTATLIITDLRKRYTQVSLSTFFAQ